MEQLKYFLMKMQGIQNSWFIDESSEKEYDVDYIAKEYVNIDSWIDSSKEEKLKDRIASLEKEIEYYKTPYYKRLLNKIKPLLNIRFKVVMYSKD